MLKKLKEGAGLEEIAEQENLTVKETGLFARTSGIVPKIGVSPEIGADAFTLKTEAPYPKEVFEAKEKIFLLKLKTKQEAQPEEFEDKKKSLEKRYSQEKSRKLMEDWSNNVRFQAKIVYSPGLAQ